MLYILTKNVDHFSCPERFSGPPLHGDLCGQSAEVGHAIRVGVVVESPGGLANESHARLVRTDQCVGSYLNSKEFLTCTCTCI